MVVGVTKYNNRVAFFKTLRLSFLDKLNLCNTFIVNSPTAEVIIDLKNLEDFDSTRLIAAMFAMRLLTGCKPYVSRFGLFQTFKEKDYDIVVCVTVRSVRIFMLLEILAHEILPFVAKVDCTTRALNIGEGTVVLFTISDLSFIRVVETHSIFFKWHDIVKIKLIFLTMGEVEASAFLSAFKVNWRLFLNR